MIHLKAPKWSISRSSRDSILVRKVKQGGSDLLDLHSLLEGLLCHMDDLGVLLFQCKRLEVDSMLVHILASPVDNEVQRI